MSLFTIKYIPQHSSQIVGQALGVAQLRDFILNYKTQKQKAALLVGPLGCGKTSSVYALAKELKLDLLEMNSSEVRNEANVKSFLSAALGQQSLFFTPKVILIDEVDNISGVHDRGCLPALLSALEKSTFPVILTANDVSDSKFNGLRKAVRTIDFSAIEHKILTQLLQSVCVQENITFEERALSSLSRQSEGDARSALIDLQCCTAKENKLLFADLKELSDRKRTETIMNALMKIFKSSSVENALPALDDVDMDAEETFLWVDENLPHEYTSPAALAKAYEHLSRAEIFYSRIRRWQHWRFLVYVNNLLTAGISSAKEKKNPEAVEYRRTMRILKLWQAKMKWAKRKEIAVKWAQKTHTSSKTAVQQMPYLQMLFKKGDMGVGIAKELELNEEEVEWLRK